MPLDARDLKRKAVHAGMGLFALLLRWLDWKQAAALAAVALLFNLFVMPRIGRGIYRDASKARDPGIVAYPAMVLVLILLFPWALPVVAAIWGMMAFGDPAASIAGKSAGGPTLPWNRKKTWSGLFAYAFVGGVAAWLLWDWVLLGANGVEWRETTLVPFLIPVALLGAFLESIESGIDDNWIPPLPCALVLMWLITSREMSWPELQWLVFAFVFNAVVGAVMYFSRAVSKSGAIAGALVGSVIFAFGRGPEYVVLWAFFALGTLATRLGYRRKQERKTAQADGGRRGARHVIANCGVAALICVIDGVTRHGDFFAYTLRVAFVAAFAAALADTLGTELGGLYGRKPFSFLERRVVPPGTPGAVSLPGVLGGLLGAAAIATIAAAVHVMDWFYVPVIAVLGLVGSLAESVLSDSLRRKGRRVDHEFANAFNTFVGAAIAWCLTNSWMIRFFN